MYRNSCLLCEKLGFIGIGTEAVTHLAEYFPTMNKTLEFAAQYHINWVWCCLPIFLCKYKQGD